MCWCAELEDASKGYMVGGVIKITVRMTTTSLDMPPPPTAPVQPWRVPAAVAAYDSHSDDGEGDYDDEEEWEEEETEEEEEEEEEADE